MAVPARCIELAVLHPLLIGLQRLMLGPADLERRLSHAVRTHSSKVHRLGSRHAGRTGEIEHGALRVAQLLHDLGGLGDDGPNVLWDRRGGVGGLLQAQQDLRLRAEGVGRAKGTESGDWDTAARHSSAGCCKLSDAGFGGAHLDGVAAQR